MGYRYRGSHKFICDVCNLEYPSEEKHKRWDGKIVCSWDYETRHPQDFVRIPKENTSIPDPRPPTDPVYINDEVTFGLITENDNPIVDDDGNYIQVPMGVLA